MKYSYHCPKCRAHLNPNQSTIVLLADCNYGTGIFMFNSEPGDYGAHIPQGVEIKGGQIWTFVCPVCHADLTVTEQANLARLILVDEKEEEHNVFFSRVAGERATFVVNAEGVVISHGEHDSMYEGLIWTKFF